MQQEDTASRKENEAIATDGKSWSGDAGTAADFGTTTDQQPADSPAVAGVGSISVSDRQPACGVADTAAWIITIVFHPVFLPLYGLLLIFNTPTLLVFMPGEIRRVLFLMVLVNNVILPLALLPLFRLRGMISSYRLENRAERIFPLLAGSFMYFVSAIMIFRFQLPGMVKSFMFASALVVLASALTSFRWKLSIHAAGVGAMVATTLIVSFRMHAGIVWFVALAFLVSGLVMSARLWLGAHSQKELYRGFVMGLAVMTLGLLI